MYSRFAAALVLLLPVLVVTGIPDHKAEAAVSETRLQRLNFFYRFQQGRNYWNSGSYLEASAHFHSLLGQYEQLPRPLQMQLDYYLGSSLHEVALYDAAEGHLRLVADRTFIPMFVVDSATRLMDIYSRRGDRRQVERVYDSVAGQALTPDLKVALDYGAVVAYSRLEEYRRVRDFALKINPDSPEYPRAMLLSAIGMTVLNEYGAAEEDLKRILRGQAVLADYGLEHLVPRVNLMLAQVLFDQGNYTESVQTLQRITDEQYRLDVLYARAWNMLMLGQYERGLEAFRDFALAHPEDPRSIEATVLGGYVLLNLAQFPESYAYFDTLETQYRDVARTVSQFRRGFRSQEALDLFLQDASRVAGGGVPPQIREWVLENRRVQVAGLVEKQVHALGRELDSFLRDMKRMRVVSAGFGSTFDNPATLERLLRNQMALRLTEIRSNILEMMLKPIREGLLSQHAREYHMVNMAQSTRQAALEIIRSTAMPTKDRAIRIQASLRGIQHYLQMVASEELVGEPDPARKQIDEKIQLPRPAIHVIDHLMTEEERVAFVLLEIMQQEENLWDVISRSTEIERMAAERILRRLGLWDTQAYIDRLELLYRSTSGIETILNDNGKLLLMIQQKILDDVIGHTQKMADDQEAVRKYQAALENSAKQVRLASVDQGYRDVIQKFREAEAKTAGGKLDVGWRIKEVEGNLMRDMLATEQQRLEQLNTYYDSVRDRAEAAAKSVALLDEQIRDQVSGSVSGEQTVELSDALDKVHDELDRMTTFVNELMRGSSWILERDATINWRPEAGAQ